LIEGNFGSVDFPETTGASEYYLDALRDEYVSNRMESIMMKSAGAKDNLTVSQRLDKMLTALSKLGQYTANVRDLSLIDIDNAAEHFETVKMKLTPQTASPVLRQGLTLLTLPILQEWHPVTASSSWDIPEQVSLCGQDSLGLTHGYRAIRLWSYHWK